MIAVLDFKKKHTSVLCLSLDVMTIDPTVGPFPIKCGVGRSACVDGGILATCIPTLFESSPWRDVVKLSEFKRIISTDE